MKQAVKHNWSAGLSSSNQPEIEDQLAGESTQSSGHAALSSGTIIRRERAGIKAVPHVATSSAPAPHPNDKRTVSRVWSPGSPRGRGGGHCQLSQQFGRMILGHQFNCPNSMRVQHSNDLLSDTRRLQPTSPPPGSRINSPRSGQTPRGGGGLLLSQQLGHMVLRQQLLRMNECSSGASVRLGSR